MEKKRDNNWKECAVTSLFLYPLQYVTHIYQSLNDKFSNH